MDHDDSAEREREATARRLVKTIEDSAASLRKLVPSADEAATHERVRELEFQNNTLSLRVQQLEATLRAYETKRNTFTMPSNGDDGATANGTRKISELEHHEMVASATAKTGQGGADTKGTVQRFAKVNGKNSTDVPTELHMPKTLEALADMQRNPRGLLTKSPSSTFRVRSESIEDVLEGAKNADSPETCHLQQALVPPSLPVFEHSQKQHQVSYCLFTHELPRMDPYIQYYIPTCKPMYTYMHILLSTHLKCMLHDDYSSLQFNLRWHAASN
jgi:hypothetical protein